LFESLRNVDFGIDPSLDRHFSSLFATLEQSCADASTSRLGAWRSTLEQGKNLLWQYYISGTYPELLTKKLATLTDAVLSHAWRYAMGCHASQATLVAVGGYGRMELYPGSDVDILILMPESPCAELTERVTRFIALPWDIGLAAAHSVRTIDQCLEEGKKDLTIGTALLESRLITGEAELFQVLQRQVFCDNFWNPRQFFQAKIQERKNRHRHFDNTPYRLEPNIKESPGGLRDIHTMLWILMSLFKTSSLTELAAKGLLNQSEITDLIKSWRWLAKLRYGLHHLHGRKEDRLLFEYQPQMTGLFGFKEKWTHVAVAQFMQIHYRSAMRVDRLSEIIHKLVDEWLNDYHLLPAMPINARFCSRNGLIKPRDNQVFIRYPYAMLEVFYLLQINPQLRGLHPQTIRLIQSNLRLLRPKYCDSICVRSLFIEILRQPLSVGKALQLMYRYGVLGEYLPEFRRIQGQSQFDLLHIYTVDQHTIFLIRHLRRFVSARHRNAFPLCSQLMPTLPRPELLYIAGLFHDLGKGSVEDHSVAGERAVYQFCLQHRFGESSAKLTAWLVRHHLLMSITAQRKDITEPAVIHDFAIKVGSTTRLNYLFLLTVADMQATNPTLLNSWRYSLLARLFHSTHAALIRGLETPISSGEIIEENQREARGILRSAGMVPGKYTALWSEWGDDYFLAYSGHTIAWHTRAILAHHEGSPEPLARIRPRLNGAGTALMVYAADTAHLFGMITAALDRMGLTIEDARLTPAQNGFVLSSYVLLNGDGSVITDESRMLEIQQNITALLTENRADFHVHRLSGLHQRGYHIPTSLWFKDDAEMNRTIMYLTTADRPGLLAKVGEILAWHKIKLYTLKATTIGERAEDVFYLGTVNDSALCPEQQEELRKDLCAQLKPLLGSSSEGITQPSEYL